ncbi:MAG: putative ATP-dependent endonuclease of OLD family [Rhodothermales bacterium]|jgi:predicted ATP-dependent endonuclease of OLD family
MRLVSLNVENFKGVNSASLELGPGLNILYGPNELGKSTLAEAIRAILLLPPSPRTISAISRGTASSAPK